ncbi:hypothetical protein M0805_009054 [Coniferiporia weirii]|nr:hypothetical protein M0805_009054 [Coniferiporia weirii]
MAMTYAALAKSLGITLKSSSSSTSSAGSLPVSTPPPASILEADSQTELPEEPKSPTLVEVKVEESPVSPVLEEPSAPAEEAEIIESSTAKADEGVEADVATDIASSRSSSPGFVAPPSPAPGIAPDNSEEAKMLTNGSSHAPAESAIASADSNEPAPPTPTSPQRSGNFPDMTAEQLHHAKVLVLDLLGWGVPPEYLLQRGISCALLRTIFTDLRLRLPDDILADRPDLVTAQT